MEKTCGTCALGGFQIGNLACAGCGTGYQNWKAPVYAQTIEDRSSTVSTGDEEIPRSTGRTPEEKVAAAVDMAREDMVNHPSHYAGHYPFEVKDIIKLVLYSYDAEELSHWEAYCLGNELKYRLRAGLKGDAQQDIDKAMKYSEFRRE